MELPVAEHDDEIQRSRHRPQGPPIPRSLEIHEDDILDTSSSSIPQHRRASWSGSTPPRKPRMSRKYSMDNSYYYDHDGADAPDADTEKGDVLNSSIGTSGRRRRPSSVATTASSASSPRYHYYYDEEGASDHHDHHRPHPDGVADNVPRLNTSPAASRASSAEASTTSQTPTVLRSNQPTAGDVAMPQTHPPNNRASTSTPTRDYSRDLSHDDDDDSSSQDDEQTNGENKSVGSSTFWASLAPPKSWRDITLGQIVDGVCGMFPEVTSGDLSSLSQLFFDNLSTILAAMYAIQDLARISPSVSSTATEGTNVPLAVDDDATLGDVDKNVSLDTLNLILFNQVATGIGLALFFGNTYYSWLAKRRRDEFGRDYTALPIGISTPYAFAMVFNVIYPIYYQERSKEGVSGDQAFITAYRVSLAANFVSGMISCAFGVFGPWILRVVPPHVLLIPCAGISIAFLGLEQVTKSFSAPIVGFNSLFWIYLSWYGNVRIGWGKYRMPEALQVLIVGVILGWATGLNSRTQLQESAALVGWIGPTWAGSQLFGQDFSMIREFMGLIIPLGITAPTLSLMCLVSTKEAGDPYPVRESLIVDGLGTIVASMFGSPFGTVVYIGHPSHKRSGALISYSFLNGILYLIFSWFGLLGVFHAIVNPAAVGPIVFLIGLYVVEDVLDFLAPRHFAAYVIGIIPSICDWVVTVSGRTPVQDVNPNSSAYNTQLLGTSSNWFGILALKRGSLLISLFWTAIVVKTIDRKWIQVSLWSLTAAIFALCGLIHSPQAGFQYLTETHWEQCQASTDDCWENAEQWMFPTAYTMLAVTALLVNAAKRCDSAIQDEIDDNYSAMAFDNWFALASKQTFVAEDNRSQSRSYLPSIREIQQFQRHALQTDEDPTAPSLSNATTAATSRPPTIDENDGDDNDFEVSDMNRGDAPVGKRVTVQDH